jgi:hypothetical protein
MSTRNKVQLVLLSFLVVFVFGGTALMHMYIYYSGAFRYSVDAYKNAHSEALTSEFSLCFWCAKGVGSLDRKGRYKFTITEETEFNHHQILVILSKCGDKFCDAKFFERETTMDE